MIPTVRLWLQPPHGPTERTAVELRETLAARFALGARLSLSDAERARVTLREIRAAIFIDAAFGARICSPTSPAPPPLTPAPSTPPNPPLLQLPPPPPPSAPPPPPLATIHVRVQLFDSFGDGWDGLQLVVSPLSGVAAPVAVKRIFSLPSGLSSTTASLSLPLGCHQLQMYHGSEPLTSTSTRDTAEASWRMLDCPTGAFSVVHLAHEVTRVCVTMKDAAEASCSMLEALMLPPIPPLPDSPPSLAQPPQELPLPPAPPPPPPLLSPSPSVASLPPPPPRDPLPSTLFESSPHLPPTVPLSSSGSQAPPSPCVPKPSPPVPPTVPLAPFPQTRPPPQLLPYAPDRPHSPAHPPPLSPSPAPPPQLPPPTPARPPSAPAKRPGREIDMVGDLDTQTFVVRLLCGVFGCALAVFLCVTCYNAHHQPRLVQAYVRRKAERDAPINSSFCVCSSSQITAAHWLEHGSDRWLEHGNDRVAQLWQQSSAQEQQMELLAADATLSSSMRPSMDSGGTSAQHARVPRAVPLFGWHRLTLSGPPLSSAMTKASANDGTIERQNDQVTSSRFTSPPLVVLATGNARMAMIKPLRQRLMLHSVVRAASAEVLKDVLLEVAELCKFEPHPSLLRLCAVVTDQPCGEMGLLSEITTGSLATLLDTSPVQLTWANSLLALATDVAAGLAHLHGLGL